MAKWSNDAVMDAALNYLKNNVTRLSVCNAQPTTKAEAATTYALATTDLTSANLTLADGTSGRKVTVAEQASVAVVNTGTATHVAMYIASGTTLCYVTTCVTQSLTSGNTVTIPSWTIQINDPT